MTGFIASILFLVLPISASSLLSGPDQTSITPFSAFIFALVYGVVTGFAGSEIIRKYQKSDSFKTGWPIFGIAVIQHALTYLIFLVLGYL